MKRGELLIIFIMGLSVLTVLGLFLVSAIRYSQKPQWTEYTLVYSGSKSGDRFGHAVDVASSGTIVIGSPGENALHIYNFTNNRLVRTHIPGTNKGMESGFGYSVAISDDGKYILAGWASNSMRVMLYSYTPEGWVSQVMSPSSISSDSLFGTSMACSSNGDVLAIGSMGRDQSGKNSGSVFVYRKNDDRNYMTIELTASDADINEYFGKSVSLSSSGDRLVVGCPWDDKNGVRSGSVYLYEWNGDDLTEADVVPLQGEEQMDFGNSVAIGANPEVFSVGADWDSEKAALAGAVFIYRQRKNDWKEDKILASDGYEGDGFGFDIGLSDSGNIAIAGAPYNDHYGSECGAAYFLYQAVGKWLQLRIIPDHTVGGSYYGFSTAISGSGNYVVIGAPGGLGGQINSGRAYFYVLE